MATEKMAETIEEEVARDYVEELFGEAQELAPGAPSQFLDTKKAYDAEKRVPVIIPEGEEQWFCLNGVQYIVPYDEMFLVPESLAMLIKQNRAEARELKRTTQRLSAGASYVNIGQVPTYIR